MTEENNPPNPKSGGIILFLGKRKQQRRAFHIPTAPAARLVPKSKSERSFLHHHRSGSSPGSSFDWKRLALFSQGLCLYRNQTYTTDIPA
jgi:hypothetical protein